MKKWYQQTDVMLGIGVVATIAMLIIPIPTFLLDILITISIGIGLVTLLTSLYNRQTNDFSVFPSLLLVTTVFRLALNVSSTRLILIEGPSFDGKLIKAFGEFVVGGNYVIGFVIFLILIFVQMMVITKGATRISEVAARFTLDALPGKQMSIDSDLSAGIITEEDARQKRTDLRREVDFYGQMDGATKFIQGDVRVGLIITGINIIGGLIIGIIFHHQTFMDALKTYTLFSIGDGLVAQIPSLLITTATGIVVTRASATSDIASDLSEQLFSNPKVLWVVAGTLFLTSLLPGFPLLSMWFIAGLLAFLAYSITKNKEESIVTQKTQQEDTNKKANNQDRFLDEITVEPLKLEIGYNLISLVDAAQGGNLLDKITSLRQKFAKDLGMIVPPIRISDNMDLASNEYCILVNGIEVSKATVYPDKLAALDRGKVVEEIKGESYKDPTFNVPSILIKLDQKEEAEQKGYLVIDANNILITHLSETLKNYATQIMGREEIKMLLDKTKEKYPAVVDEVIKGMSQGAIQQVLHNLLKEGISIRNLVVILESLADNCERIKDPTILTDLVRQKLNMQIMNKYLNNNILKAIQIDPLIENELRASIYSDPKEGRLFSIPPRTQGLIRDALLDAFKKAQANALFPIFLTASDVRIGIFMILEREMPTRSFAVIAYEEIPSHVKFESIGQAILQQNEFEEEEVNV